MPIDYLSQRQQAAQGTKDLLIRQRMAVPQQVYETGANINNADNAFLGSTVGANNPSLAYLRPRLQRANNATLNQQQFDQSKIRQNMIYQHAVQQAVQAGYDVQSADAFARQFMADQQRRNFEADQNTAAINHENTMSERANYYRNQGTDLQAKYAPQNQNNFGAAALRAVLGTGAAIGTSYYLNKNYLKNQPQPANGTSPNVPAPGYTPDYINDPYYRNGYGNS